MSYSLVLFEHLQKMNFDRLKRRIFTCLQLKMVSTWIVLKKTETFKITHRKQLHLRNKLQKSEGIQGEQVIHEKKMVEIAYSIYHRDITLPALSTMRPSAGPRGCDNTQQSKHATHSLPYCCCFYCSFVFVSPGFRLNNYQYFRNEILFVAVIYSVIRDCT